MRQEITIELPYNFTFNNKIERIYVTAAVQAHLVAGRLVIVCLGFGQAGTVDMHAKELYVAGSK